MTDDTRYIPNEEQMLAFAAEFAAGLSAGDVVYLEGDLGAGKTTTVRGILRYFGYEGNVKSPTYTLVEPYDIMLNGQPVILYHFDLYRLGEPEELEYMGGRDYFADNTLCLIEWPKKAEGYLPTADKWLKIEHNGKGRNIDLSI
jgi:tRNA threonylcarbamoyladenosine biosynthesis protein TsaE